MATMVETLRDFIAVRLSELKIAEGKIRDDIARLSSLLDPILAEQAELETAGKAVGMFNDAPKTLRRSGPELTIKEAVIQVLNVAHNGLTASEILEKINEIMGTDYARTSLSPQLSRLKQDGKIELDGQVWRIARSGGQPNVFAEILRSAPKLASERQGDDNPEQSDDGDDWPEEDEWGEPLKEPKNE